jgi:hypothetical protein
MCNPLGFRYIFSEKNQLNSTHITVMIWIFLSVENLIFSTLKLVIISGNTNKSITKESNVASSEA